MCKTHCFIWGLLLTVQCVIAQRQVLTNDPVNHISAFINNDSAVASSHSTFYPLPGVIQKNNSSVGELSYFRKKMFREHFITVDSGNFHLEIDPVFNFQIGQDITDAGNTESNDYLYVNTRGFMVNANITKKVGFQSSFLENQAVLPLYISEFTRSTGMVPGQGRAKVFKEGYDYAMASGLLFIQPNDDISIMLGHGKNKIGSGYRSLFLSENSHNYPYLKTNVKLLEGKLEYGFLFAVFQDNYRLAVSDDTESPFLRKSASIHHISWKPTENLTISLVESTVFQHMDSSGRTTFYAGQINPLPLINSATYGLTGKHNGLLGLDLNYQISEGLLSYGQLVWNNDQFNQNAFQLGFRYLSEGRILLLAEYNQVAANFYGPGDRVSRYTHMGQFLSHPSGHGFKEAVGMGRLVFGNWFFSYKGNLIKYTSDLGDRRELGVENAGATVLLNELNVGYLLNKANGMSLNMGILSRQSVTGKVEENAMIYLGFRTYLPPFCYDF